MSTITQKTVKQLFSYTDGVLFWKIKPSQRTNIGQEAGWVTLDGYKALMIGYKAHLVHRLVFLYHHGHLPKVVDHINGNRQDNRVENLREVTTSQNIMNSKLSRANTSGFKGVSWDNSTQKWIVRVSVNKKQVSFGNYVDLELAGLVAQEARDLYYGEYARNA